MRSPKLLAVAIALLIACCPAINRAADKDARGFLDRVHKDPDGEEAKYVVFVPHDYDGSKPYPCILFLHGLGESGNDGKKQATVGIGPAIKAQEKTFPFITIFPQSQERSWHSETDDGQRAIRILDEVQKEFKVDPKRVYLTGLSMGGGGTWSLATRYPEKWAAIAPVCGVGGYRKQAPKIKDIPCWCFHGDADKGVPIALSRTMIKAIETAGGKPKFTEYPGVGHNCWDKAYGTPELYEWMLKQQRK